RNLSFQQGLKDICQSRRYQRKETASNREIALSSSAISPDYERVVMLLQLHIPERFSGITILIEVFMRDSQIIKVLL
ncbi:MAG: hypothetical protein QGH40_07695, partial [bacterium]|nr:hypothetical protein [bacterium]